MDEILVATEFHTRHFKKTKIDLLLIPCDKDIEKYGEDLKGLMIGDYVENIGLKFPKNLKELESAKEKLEASGIELKYIALDICPYNFDYPIIKWCNENGIHIIGFNPFGGFKSCGCMISSFTAAYLLGFISNYATLVFLSGRNLEISYDSKIYLESLIGKDTSPKYILRKSVKKLVPGFGEIISCGIVLKPDFIVPIELPEYLFPFDELRISYGKSIPETDHEFWDLDTNTIEDDMINTYGDLRKPEDGNDVDFLSIIRPKVA